MESAPASSRRDMWVHMLLYPGHTLPTALAPVLVAAGLARHDGVFSAGPMLLAFLAGWLIQFIGDIRDRAFDVVKGKRTVAVRFGPAWSRAEFVALLALAYIAPLAFWLGMGFGARVLLPLLTLPYAVSTVRAVLTLDRIGDLVPMTPKAARLLLAYAALLAGGVAYG